MQLKVGPFENIPMDASITTVAKGLVCDDTVINAVNSWLQLNPGYYYIFRYRPEHGIISEIEMEIRYNWRNVPQNKTIITQLKRVNLDKDYYSSSWFRRPNQGIYLDKRQEEIIKELSSSYDGFKIRYIRPVHRQNEWGKKVETERIIHYEYFESIESTAGTRDDLTDTNWYYNIPLIPIDLGYRAKDLAYADATLRTLQRIKKLNNKESLYYLKEEFTKNQEKVLTGKLKGYLFEELLSVHVNTNPINWLKGGRIELAPKLN